MWNGYENKGIDHPLQPTFRGEMKNISNLLIGNLWRPVLRMFGKKSLTRVNV